MHLARVVSDLACLRRGSGTDEIDESGSLAALDGEEHHGTNQAHNRQKENIQQNGSSFRLRQMALKCFSVMAALSQEERGCLTSLISTENQMLLCFTASL